jgi:aspartate racemase
MRTIGLIGGMSWESTTLYYQIINREIARRLGGLHSAKLHLHSLDFAEVVMGQREGAWDRLAAMLSDAARGLEKAGADCVLIGTNTMHRVADDVQRSLSVPLLHIADVTADAICASGCRSVALLGTQYTMEQSFYVDHLARRAVACIVPERADREEVHRIIFEELCKGDFNESSRARLVQIIERQVERGAQGVVLGCTELPLTICASQLPAPLFDTTRLHALAAADFALGAHATLQ